MKRIWIFAAILMCFFTVYQITSSYAKYITEVEGELQKNIGKWLVKVNNTNISTGTQVQNFQINQLQYNSDSHVKQNKIAPGLIGYFDIEIDASETDVAVIYDVILDFSQMNISDSIKFSRLVRIENEEEVDTGIIRTGDNTYTGIIALGENATTIRKDILRIYIEWEEDNLGTNDEEDSELGNQYGLTLAIPVEVKVSQYSGETIEEYTEPIDEDI